MRLAGNGHALFLHGLEQGRLRPGAGTVNFICHQQLTEHRAGDEAKRPLAAVTFLEHLGAQNISRHKIGRTLYALVFKTKNRAEGFHQASLCQAWNADQQRVPAGQESDKCLIDDLVLTEDDAMDALTGGFQLASERLNLLR